MIRHHCLSAASAAALLLTGCNGAASPPAYGGGGGGDLVNPLARAGSGASGARYAAAGRFGGACPAVPPVSGMLGIKHRIDTADAANALAQRAVSRDAARPVNALASAVTRATGQFLASGRRDTASAACAMRIMDGWARANALQGSFNDPGLAQRRWVVNAAAVDFLAIADAPGIDPGQRARVAAWLGRTGRAIVDSIGSYRNNHLYWAAAAVSATAIASGDRQSFQWAVAQARDGLLQVTAQGTLPLEMKRRQLAMNYHVFALEPLVQVAGFAKANGIDLYRVNGGALGRLAGTVVANLANPRAIADDAGAPQAFDGPTPDTQSWMEQYFADTGDCRVGRLLARARPVTKGYLGGNTTLLYGAPLGRCG